MNNELEAGLELKVDETVTERHTVTMFEVTQTLNKFTDKRYIAVFERGKRIYECLVPDKSLGENALGLIAQKIDLHPVIKFVLIRYLLETGMAEYDGNYNLVKVLKTGGAV